MSVESVEISTITVLVRLFRTSKTTFNLTRVLILCSAEINPHFSVAKCEQTIDKVRIFSEKLRRQNEFFFWLKSIL